MARIKLHIPAALVDPLYQDLEMIWEDRSESIMESETGQLAPRPDSAANLRRAKAQRHAIGALLDQVDWDNRREDEPVDLVGDHAFLDYVVRPLLYVLGERINEACQATVDRGDSIEPIVEALALLEMLLGLLGHTSRAGRGSDPVSEA